MATYTPTIGLEIHAELKTTTKMFCQSKNDPDESRPNVNVCPICLAYPGTLPVVNKAAVEHVLRVGAAIDGEIADYTEFDRKNYFYPDIPKGYQISQYEYPLIKGGKLAGVDITRIHLEEDTANSKHVGEASTIDYNRAGLPLMELVTEPVIHDALTASSFAKELQTLLRTLGAGEANMEKGQMRVEVNISLSRDSKLGTKVEVKNINSFKSVERAIAYEIKRQTEVLEQGGILVQETRGFDEDTGETFSQRAKESSHDYRYFPDPDIPKFKLSLLGLTKESLKKTLPELPWEKRARYVALGMRAIDADLLVGDHEFGALADSVILNAAYSDKTKSLALNYLISDVRGLLKESTGSLGEGFMKLMELGTNDTLSSAAIKLLLPYVLAGNTDPEALAKERGLVQIVDTAAIEAVVDQVIQSSEKVVTEYKAGKIEVIQYLIGQAMKASKGAAKPAMLKQVFESKLK